MLGLVLLSALILSCISGPLVQQESAAQQQASQLLVTDYAVDINTSVPLTAFQCFHQYEHKVAFIRAYHPSGQGQVDQNATGNIQRARAAGLVIEAYMVPQPNSNKSGRLQFDEMYNNLMQSSIAIHSVWIQERYDTQMPIGAMANKEKSKHITGDSPGLASAMFTGIAEIAPQ
ncbi:hypothetical protein TELCIR_19126, partial [Teladorsagia circumcincta]